MKLDNYNKTERHIVDVGWGKVETLGSVVVPIDELYASIKVGKDKQYLKIINTPHYKWIYSLVNNTNDIEAKTIYKKYLEEYFADTAVLDLQKSKDTVEFYKKSKPDILTIVVWPINDIIIIFDGIHRTAIAKSMGYELIKCLIYNRGV